MKLSFIIPALNEQSVIEDCLLPLQALRRDGHEVILVDGGSEDGTVDMAGGLADRIIQCPQGRARQMNAGAAIAQGDVLIFLHADTLPEFDFGRVLPAFIQSDLAWGRFDIRLSGDHSLLRIIEFCMNYRSRLTGMATGDQGIFMTRKLFDKVNGFPDIDIMEDLAISERLKRYSRPLCIKHRLVTSSRRWEQQGIIKTVVKMWGLRFRYFLGVKPGKLAEEYDR